jgi:hypothetical protein
MLPFPPLGKVAGTAAVEIAQGSDSCPDHGMNDYDYPMNSVHRAI